MRIYSLSNKICLYFLEIKLNSIVLLNMTQLTITRYCEFVMQVSGFKQQILHLFILKDKFLKIRLFEVSRLFLSPDEVSRYKLIKR